MTTDLDTIIRLCRDYNRLGYSVQEQLADVLEGRVGDCNPNALLDIERFLNDVKAAAEGIRVDDPENIVCEVDEVLANIAALDDEDEGNWYESSESYEHSR